MNNKKESKIIIGLFASILLIGVFLIGIVSANKAIQTIKSLEYEAVSTYSPVTYYFKAFSEIDIDQDTSKLVMDSFDALIEGVNGRIATYTDYAIVDNKADIIMVSDESDPLLSSLVYTLENDSRKLIGNYDYYNVKIGNYNLLLKIECGGIINILVKNNLLQTILTNVIVFACLSIALLACFYFVKSNKLRKLIGLVFIIIWIGSISVYSAFDLSKQYNNIIADETKHITSLVSYYYRQDIIENGATFSDYRGWAEEVIMQFSNANDFILGVELNDNYDSGNLDISNCLTFTYNENSIRNKNIEFAISATLFLILALLIYDQVIKVMFANDANQSYESLQPLDRKIAMIELINLAGNFLTNSIVLPRLLEIAKTTFPDGGSGYVATAFSLGLTVNAIFTVLSSFVLKKVKSAKAYYCFAFSIGLVGLCAFVFSESFILVVLANCLLNVKTGLSNLQAAFYISPCKDEDRHEQFRIYSQNTQKIGQSIGIIVGGVLGSILEYRYVFLIAVIIVIPSVLLIYLTDKKQYPTSEEETKKSSFKIKDIFNMKLSILYCVLIVFSKSFYDVYVDYKFPIDIINLGLTTVVISFISMLSRLISAYSGKFVFTLLKKKFDYSNMTFLFVFGTAITMLIYQLDASIVMIGIITVVLGIFDGFGGICYKQAFVEVAKPEGIPENDAGVILKMTSKLGGSIGPSIIELFGNVVFLPIYMLIALPTYMFAYRKRKSSS